MKRASLRDGRRLPRCRQDDDAGPAGPASTRSAGQRVGLVTNDQAQDLVDTNSLRAQGFPVEEVAGACFCCRFDDLVGKVERPASQRAARRDPRRAGRQLHRPRRHGRAAAQGPVRPAASRSRPTRCCSSRATACGSCATRRAPASRPRRRTSSASSSKRPTPSSSIASTSWRPRICGRAGPRWSARAVSRQAGAARVGEDRPGLRRPDRAARPGRGASAARSSTSTTTSTPRARRSWAGSTAASASPRPQPFALDDLLLDVGAPAAARPAAARRRGGAPEGDRPGGRGVRRGQPGEQRHGAGAVAAVAGHVKRRGRDRQRPRGARPGGAGSRGAPGLEAAASPGKAARSSARRRASVRAGPCRRIGMPRRFSCFARQGVVAASP